MGAKSWTCALYVGIQHHLWVVEQHGTEPFNRGFLLNIGFLAAAEDSNLSQYISLHDVDLLPTAGINYAFPR